MEIIFMIGVLALAIIGSFFGHKQSLEVIKSVLYLIACLGMGIILLYLILA